MNASLVAFTFVSALLIGSIAGCSASAEAPVDSAPPVSSERVAGDAAPPDGWGSPESWLVPTEVQLDPAEFVSGVDNPYWPLEPGTMWVYEAEVEDGTERIEVVVEEETRMVAGIECVVVRDTVSIDGALVEDTWDWYAQDTEGNVWYMGEDSTEYENGEAVSTAGSWEAGVDGALPGIKVWAEPRVGGEAYYQEVYRREAEDLGRDLATDGTASVAFGDYADLLVVEEWNKLAPDAVELKYYAEGIGVVMEETTRGGDEVVELVEFTMP